MTPVALALQPAKLELVADAEREPAADPPADGVVSTAGPAPSNSDDLFVVRKPVERKLTVAEMMEYARRTYGRRRPIIASRQRCSAPAAA